ncbi:hypothetical protein AB07_1034 [Citrobacter freundii]|jgi:hypothetical protein|uniref:Uncharacterized protein n=1 Tax=Citrobacter freundii TaxID=546 RepID=A0A7G2INY3_CITFR|nr:hypothetical protein AB07_1034 [Citrobacter freundii]CDL38905.1 hypothetical protein [Citrobacter freundii]
MEHRFNLFQRGIAPGNDALKQGMLARCCESGSITNGV